MEKDIWKIRTEWSEFFLGSTKSGGGTQGREVKMKATKKKYMKGRGDQGGDSDEEEVSRPRQQEIQFMSIEEISEVLKEQKELRDCPEDFITEIATQIHRWVEIRKNSGRIKPFFNL